MTSDPSSRLSVLPVPGHRVDFQIHPSTFLTRAICECRWHSDWWDEAANASYEWRDHVGLDE